MHVCVVAGCVCCVHDVLCVCECSAVLRRFQAVRVAANFCPILYSAHAQSKHTRERASRELHARASDID